MRRSVIFVLENEMLQKPRVFISNAACFFLIMYAYILAVPTNEIETENEAFGFYDLKTKCSAKVSGKSKMA